jgi:hypothetical protein
VASRPGAQRRPRPEHRKRRGSQPTRARLARKLVTKRPPRGDRARPDPLTSRAAALLQHPWPDGPPTTVKGRYGSAIGSFRPSSDDPQEQPTRPSGNSSITDLTSPRIRVRF